MQIRRKQLAYDTSWRSKRKHANYKYVVYIAESPILCTPHVCYNKLEEQTVKHNF